MTDDITSPLDGQQQEAAAFAAFAAWLAKLDKIIWRRVGCSLDDLEDFNTYDGYEDGLTPAEFYKEYIEEAVR